MAISLASHGFSSTFNQTTHTINKNIGDQTATVVITGSQGNFNVVVHYWSVFNALFMSNDIDNDGASGFTVQQRNFLTTPGGLIAGIEIGRNSPSWGGLNVDWQASAGTTVWDAASLWPTDGTTHLVKAGGTGNINTVWGAASFSVIEGAGREVLIGIYTTDGTVGHQLLQVSINGIPATYQVEYGSFTVRVSMWRVQVPLALSSHLGVIAAPISVGLSGGSGGGGGGGDEDDPPHSVQDLPCPTLGLGSEACIIGRTAIPPGYGQILCGQAEYEDPCE